MKVAPDPEAACAAAAELFVSTAAQAHTSGRVHIVLAGGRTPRRAYELVAERAGQVAWSRVELYFGDERAVPPEHPESNYRMLRESLLDRVPVEPSQVHRIRGEDAPARAAEEYSRLVAARCPHPDLILLGLGQDGHTASLFPGQPYMAAEPDALYMATEAPGGQPRVSASLSFLNAATQVAFLVVGADKADIVARVIAGDQRLPAACVQPRGGRPLWLLDAAAAQRLQ